MKNCQIPRIITPHDDINFLSVRASRAYLSCETMSHAIEIKALPIDKDWNTEKIKTKYMLLFFMNEISLL